MFESLLQLSENPGRNTDLGELFANGHDLHVASSFLTFNASSLAFEK